MIRTRPGPEADDCAGGEQPPTAKPTRRGWNDRGSSILEFAGFLPILLVVGMAAIQLGLVGYGINQAGTAARAAARTASQCEGGGEAAGIASASTWLSPNVLAPECAGDTVTATVTVNVPSIIPLFTIPPIQRSVTMPTDNPDD